MLACLGGSFLFAVFCSPVICQLATGGTLVVAFVSVGAIVGMIVMFRGRSLNDPQRVTELRCAKPVVSLVSALPVYPSNLGGANCGRLAAIRTVASLLVQTARPYAHVC